MTELKCKDKVRAACHSRMADLKRLWKQYSNPPEGDSERESVEDELFNYGLSFDYVPAHTFRDQKEGYFRYQISCGGPSEEFRIFVNLDYEPYRIEFWFLDWFDGAKKTLTGVAFDFFADFFSAFFVELGSAQYAYLKVKNE